MSVGGVISHSYPASERRVAAFPLTMLPSSAMALPAISSKVMMGVLAMAAAILVAVTRGMP